MWGEGEGGGGGGGEGGIGGWGWVEELESWKVGVWEGGRIR